jgi:hypothetical protein
VKKGNAAIPQVKIKWTKLPEAAATWEDYNVLKTRFPNSLAWGQASAVRKRNPKKTFATSENMYLYFDLHYVYDM